MPKPQPDVLPDVARREYAAFERRADALDAKAGLVLGFAGLLVSVTPPELPDGLVVVVRALAAAAALLALGAFATPLPTAGERGPVPRRPDRTAVIHALAVNAVASSRVAGKARRVHASLRLLGAALATIVGGTTTVAVLDS